MNRLSDTILNLSIENGYSAVERSERIEAALEKYTNTITEEIASAIAMSFYDSATSIEVAKAQIKLVLEKRL